MSKSVIFKQTPRASSISWQLAQTFWVGGLWLLHFVLLPALAKYGLAPLLIDELGAALSSLLVGFSVFCVLLQLLVLLQVSRWKNFFSDIRAQLLVTAQILALSYLATSFWLPDALRWLVFNYLLLAFCGLLLVIQPIPGTAADWQRRAP